MSQPKNDRRKEPRCAARFDTLCSDGPREGAGVLVDVSRGGARVAETSFTPEIGATVRLYVFVQPVSPFEVVGRVVRREEGEFAIEYTIEDSQVRDFVDEVAAILAD